jgi:predicted patatin/cPLA2 family phospholipase
MWKILLLCYIGFASAFKSLIIKPGGTKGYYMMGMCKYIKDHYDLSDWHFYGSSAGAWNALYLSCKKENENEFMQQTQELGQFSYRDLYDLEKTMKKRLLTHFTIDDFDVSKLHICVSRQRKGCFYFEKNVIRDFFDLDDLIECCIASSHLPFLSNGKFSYTYRNEECVDGGFHDKPYTKMDNVTPTIILRPNMWENPNIDELDSIYSLDIFKLLYYGYNDAYQNREFFEEHFR